MFLSEHILSLTYAGRENGSFYCQIVDPYFIARQIKVKTYHIAEFLCREPRIRHQMLKQMDHMYT